MRTEHVRAWSLLAAALVLASTAAALAFPARDARDEVFYHFMPIAWRDSNNDASRFGDFGGMTASLDYLEDLGVTAIWMNPIFPSVAYHGYQHNAANELNAWFGTEADFTAFLEAAHARGIRVFVDFVVYGVSRDNVWFQDAYGNPSSAYDDWFAFNNTANTDYLGSTYTTWNGSTVRFVHWNLNNADVVNMVIGWSQHWLDPNSDGDFSDGVDGYRLDHVWANYNQGPNGWGYNIDDFWIPWKQALQAVNPDVFTFAEQADWGSYGVDLLPAHDATMTKPLEFAARDALASENASGLYSQMSATVAALPAGKQFVGIIGDHDVDRLASAIGDSFTKGKAAAAVLLTQPFPPIIYYGDEIGMRGTKNTSYSGDAADIPMREPFKWNAVAGAPMSNYFVLNSAAYNGRVERNNDGRSVEEQQGVSGSLLEEYKKLVAARKANVALRHGSYHSVPASNNAVFAFVRYDDAQQVLVAINLSGSAVSQTLNLTGYTIPGGSTTPTNVITSAALTTLTTANQAAYPSNLAAYGYVIAALSIEPPAPPESAVDGREIPADVGAAALVATQDNATALGDNLSELDQLFVKVENDTLRIGLTGNLATDATALALFFDTVSGGQNTLDLSNTSPPPAGPDDLTGLRFDDGFTPDHLIFVNAYGGTIYVDQYALLTAGGISKTYRGNGTVGDGDGILAGGSNPHGMEIALDNSNTAGVTGADASGAATATTGFEMIIPYADIGLASGALGNIGLVAFEMRSDGTVSNQWLPGLGGGYSNLGVAPDLRNVPGNQFALVALSGVGDLNCDGTIDNFDIDPFVVALTSAGDLPKFGQYYVQYPNCNPLFADANGDGAVNNFDIDPFVQLLLSE